MVVNTEAQGLLIDLGLTEYEARAYVALMQCQPATAYELSRISGIPSSKIYETVSRLEEKGLAQPTSEVRGRGQRYMALNSEDFMCQRREETTRKTARLGPLLSAIGSDPSADLIWKLTGRDPVLDRARQLIGQAGSFLLVSLWPEELHELETDLRKADARGVRIALVHFGAPASRVGATFHHPAERTLYDEKGGRGLTLVCDGLSAATATFFADGRIEGAWSRNRAFVTLAEDYVRHDVYITKVTATMDTELRGRFGDEYEDLRDVFKSAE